MDTKILSFFTRLIERRCRLIFMAAMITWIQTVPVHAVSYDCVKALSADERAVCADPHLSELDTLNAAAFDEARRKAGPATVVPLARESLAGRRACASNTSCLMASYMLSLDLYRNLGASVMRPVWADATAIAAGNAPASNSLPTIIGRCATTQVTEVTPRLDVGHKPTSEDFDSGTAINFANQGHQVSYDREEELLKSQPGNTVTMCLISIPRHCPPGDSRGRVYAVTNLVTRGTWILSDSQHSCGGA